MLYFIGLGLGDENDITLRGLKAVRASEKVYLESYTSLLGVSKESLVCSIHRSYSSLFPCHRFISTSKTLCPFHSFILHSQEKLYDKEIIIADREFVEEKADEMIDNATTATVSFLVVGDPFG